MYRNAATHGDPEKLLLRGKKWVSEPPPPCKTGSCTKRNQKNDDIEILSFEKGTKAIYTKKELDFIRVCCLKRSLLLVTLLLREKFDKFER